MAGLVRTLLIDAGGRLERKCMAKDAFFAWAVGHAAFLHNRFQSLQRGPTPFEQVQHRGYRSRMLPFGSPVLMRLPAALEQPKLEPRWRRGLWLGRRADSDEHIVGLPDGVSASRPVKLLDDVEGVDALVKAMTWTPAYQRPAGEEPQPQPGADAGQEVTAPTPRKPKAPLGSA